MGEGVCGRYMEGMWRVSGTYNERVFSLRHCEERLRPVRGATKQSHMGFNCVDLREDPHKRLLRRATHSSTAAPRNDADGLPAQVAGWLRP